MWYREVGISNLLSFQKEQLSTDSILLRSLDKMILTMILELQSIAIVRTPSTEELGLQTNDIPISNAVIWKKM